MNPLIRHFQNDGYPAVSWTQGNPTIGSFDGSTRFRMGVSGGVFVAQNTAPPYDTQTDLYSQTMLSVSPEFAGTDAEVAAAIVANYEWRLSNLNNMAVSGVSAGAWNAFNASGFDVATFVITEPIINPPGYTVSIREKGSGAQVAYFNYDLDGF